MKRLLHWSALLLLVTIPAKGYAAEAESMGQLRQILNGVLQDKGAKLLEAAQHNDPSATQALEGLAAVALPTLHEANGLDRALGNATDLRKVLRELTSTANDRLTIRMEPVHAIEGRAVTGVTLNARVIRQKKPTSYQLSFSMTSHKDGKRYLAMGGSQVGHPTAAVTVEVQKDRGGFLARRVHVPQGSGLALLNRALAAAAGVTRRLAPAAMTSSVQKGLAILGLPSSADLERALNESPSIKKALKELLAKKERSTLRVSEAIFAVANPYEAVGVVVQKRGASERLRIYHHDNHLRIDQVRGDETKASVRVPIKTNQRLVRVRQARWQ